MSSIYVNSNGCSKYRRCPNYYTICANAVTDAHIAAIDLRIC